MLVLKLYFCQEGSFISKESADSNFLYDLDFTERSITKAFSSVPGKDVTYYQLPGECGNPVSYFDYYFQIHFDVYKNETKEITRVTKIAYKMQIILQRKIGN